MRAPVIAALVASAVALSAVGCGVTTVDRTYDDSLIREVGSGSQTLASITSTVEKQANAAQGFTDPQNDRATTLLLQGQLARLTPQDLVRLANTNRKSLVRFQRVLRQLDRIEADLRGARVDVSKHAGLSDGAKRFLAAWNDYLAANATRMQTMRRTFTSMLPLFNEFQALLRAAYDTARLQSTGHFDHVRDRVISDVKRRSQHVQTTVKRVASYGPADRKFADLVSHNQEAQAIVNQVNKRYPNGSLAQEFTKG